MVCLVAILVAILTIVFTHRSNPKVKESEDGDEGDPVVQTAKGKLKGIREHSVGGQPFLSFYAIPFASPPTGRLRFQVIFCFCVFFLVFFFSGDRSAQFFFSFSFLSIVCMYVCMYAYICGLYNMILYYILYYI